MWTTESESKQAYESLVKMDAHADELAQKIAKANAVAEQAHEKVEEMDGTKAYKGDDAYTKPLAGYQADERMPEKPQTMTSASIKWRQTSNGWREFSRKTHEPMDTQ